MKLQIGAIDDGGRIPDRLAFGFADESDYVRRGTTSIRRCGGKMSRMGAGPSCTSVSTPMCLRGRTM
jgi:hypothetical protein